MPHPWEVGDESQRWDAYLHPVYNLVLRNKLDPGGERIVTPDQLRRAEGDVVERRLATLPEQGLPATYDLDGLKSIHCYLFQDVYEWAGDLRTVNMARGQGVPFAPYEDIEAVVAEVASMVKDTDLLRAVPSEKYPDSLAVVFHGLNVGHSFREGNGRVQRAFVSALAAESGSRIDWTEVPGKVNDFASRLAREGDMRPLQEVFSAIVREAPDTTAPFSPGRGALCASFPERPSPRGPEQVTDAEHRQDRHEPSQDRDYGRE